MAIPSAVRVLPEEALSEGRRVHEDVNGRRITLLRHNGEVLCIDRLCNHMQGPLGDGDIEELGGLTCIRCPSHGRRFDLGSGRQVEIDFHGRLCASAEAEQRVHQTRCDADGWIWVQLEISPPMASDICNTIEQQPLMRGGPGWGYGLGGPSQAVVDAGNPSFVHSSPPQPVTPFAGVERRPLIPSPTQAYQPLSTVFPGQKLTAAAVRRKMATQAVLKNATQPPVAPVKQPASSSAASAAGSRGLVQTDLRALFGRQSQSAAGFSELNSQTQHSLTTDMEF